MIRTIQFKLYPSKEQAATLDSWLSKCCWLYNRCLEQRIKAYKRRKQSINYYDQQKLLTEWRQRIGWLRLVPRYFSCDAIARVDLGMQAFFRRLKQGKNPGFPRFKPRDRYRSLEQMTGEFKHVRGKAIYVSKIGEVRARGQFGIEGKQIGLRIIKRASGWYAQVLMDITKSVVLPPTGNECGIDLGLESFATLDNGERIENPRLLRRAAKKLKRTQQRLARCQRGSNRRRKAKVRIAQLYEKLVRKRRGFHHRTSRDLVNRFDRIAVEKLNVKGLASGMLAKSVNDVAWGSFLQILRYKAESAGRVVIEVDPSYTSQTCPQCGVVAKKELSERTHSCGCGLTLHRDHAAAMIVRQRAFRPARGELISPGVIQAGSVKRGVLQE